MSSIKTHDQTAASRAQIDPRAIIRSLAIIIIITISISLCYHPQNRNSFPTKTTLPPPLQIQTHPFHWEIARLCFYKGTHPPHSNCLGGGLQLNQTKRLSEGLLSHIRGGTCREIQWSHFKNPTPLHLIRSVCSCTYKSCAMYPSILLCILTNSMAYGTRRFNAVFTRALQ